MKKITILTGLCMAAGSVMAQPVANPASSTEWHLGGNNNAAGQFNVIGPNWAPAGAAPQMWFTTEGFFRMLIYNGAGANNNGRIGMGNSLAPGFTPQSRLHLHQTDGSTYIKFTNDFISSSNTRGLSVGNTQAGLVFYNNYEIGQPQTFSTNTGVINGTFERMRINAINANGFIGMGNSANFVALSQLHINTIGANAAAAQLGEVFRTEGPSNLDNNWRMLTSQGAGTVQRGRIFTSSTTGNVKNPAGYPLLDNFNIEATRADMVFWANGRQPQGSTIRERMRITTEQIATGQVTRVGITRNINPVTDPRTMLHIGDGFAPAGVGGHRVWQDIGTFYNQNNDMLYTGLDSLGADLANAIISWGDNPVTAFGATGGIGDRLMFRFTSPSNGTTVSAAQRGIELMRMVTDGDNGRVGIGDFPNNAVPSIDPGNTLEIISSANSPRPAGLRFRNLTCNSTPVNQCNAANPVVLSVDANGDVILVPGGGTGSALGNACAAAQNPLASDWEIPLNGNNFHFTGQGTADYNVGIGTNCLLPTAKLEVIQTQGPGNNKAIACTTSSAGTLNTGVRVDAINGVQNYGMDMAITGSTSNTNTLVNASHGIRMTMNNNQNRVYGLYQDITAQKDAWGQRVIVNSPNQVNVTGVDVTASALYFTIPSNTAVGGRFEAKGAYQNMGVIGTATGNANNPVFNTAGTFDASGAVGGNNYGIKSSAIHNNSGTIDDNVGLLSVVDITGTGTVNDNVGVAGIARVTSGTAATSNVGVYGEGANAAQFFGPVAAGPQITFSDQKIKTNIKPVESGLSIVNKLNPVTYDFKVAEFPELHLTDDRQYGFIAQEVEKVIPELVDDIRKPELKDAEGNIISKGGEYKGVNYEALIPVLTRSIQEQQKQIEELKEMVMNLAAQKQGSTGQNQTNQVEVELSDKNVVVLNQNVPNPFAESTVITYNIPENTGFAQVIFYNSNGQLIKAVDIREKGAGQLNVFANDLSNGTYTYTLVVDGKTIDTKRMIKTK